MINIRYYVINIEYHVINIHYSVINNTVFCELVISLFEKILVKLFIFFLFVLILVFATTFSNISAISWRPVLVVEEAAVPGENHRSWESNW